jgi:hypothetical protein
MKAGHKIYIFSLSALVFGTVILIIYAGYSYYSTRMEERFFHPDHTFLKPGGIGGHGLGVIGSACMLLGVGVYMARKRFHTMRRMGILKHWLEFHIFLCTLGPFLVLFHTSFKFGGIVAVSFWSMVAVFLSGIIGRFIYIQIPRSIEGRELSLNEVRELKTNIRGFLKENFAIDEESSAIIEDSTKKKVELYDGNPVIRLIRKMKEDRRNVRLVKTVMKRNNITGPEARRIVILVKHEILLNRRIDRLVTMQNLFKYWHVAHLPFAIIMLIIMIIHVAVTIAFGYRWIF